MVDQAGAKALRRDGHFKCGQRRLGAQVIVRRPAHDAAAVKIHEYYSSAETLRLAVSKRGRARSRRLLGLCVFLVRDRHDRAGLRRRYYRQDHPPHRYGARHYLLCLQHRVDGQYRGKRHLAARRTRSRAHG
jgi:hypothetical protein